MSTFLIVLVVVVAGYAAWYINKVYSTPLKSTFVVKKVEPVIEVKKEEPVVKVKKVRKPRTKKSTKKK